ncbi:MAG: nucleotidyltransferase domain-containing protein [Planctomycetes bacterium]|nr:nucleotidyltransferase domain-containing protein [Planctomycetota bacterium]
MSPHDVSLVNSFRQRLPADVGERVRAIKVFGSRARGQDAADSDLDVLVLVDRWDAALEKQIEDAAYGAMWDDDFRVILSVKVFSEGEFLDLARRGWSFFRAVQRDGISV